MSSYRTALVLPALILFISSLICTVLLLQSFGTNNVMMILLSMTGVGLEVCKIAFFPMSASFFNLRSRYGFCNGVASLVLGLMLMIVSIMATVGFLERSIQQKNTAVNKESFHYRELQQQIEDVNEKLAQQRLLIRLDTEGGYRQRAIDQLSKMKSSEERKTQLLESLKSYRETPITSAGLILEGEGKHLGGHGFNHRQGAFIFMAILMEGCTVILLCWLTYKPRDEAGVNEIADNLDRGNEELTSLPALNDSSPRINDVIGAVKKMDRGEIIKPARLREELGINYNFVKRAFELMESQGLVIKSGRSWVRVS